MPTEPASMNSNKMTSADTGEDKIKSWELPYVEQSIDEQQTKTNALNRRSTWRYEPPEPEEQIQPLTAEDLEAIRQAAYEEGFTEGKKDGFEQGQKQGVDAGTAQGYAKGLEEGQVEGLEQGQATIQEQSHSWQQLIDALHNPVANTFEQAQQELVLLAVSLARSVIDIEVRSNPAVITEALKKAIHTLPVNETKLHIRLHPDDIALIKAEFGQAHIDTQQWHFVASPEMSRGGCDLSTDNNAVDYSIERRSKDVIETFLIQQGLSDGQG